MKKISLLLKKEKQQMSLWLKISFCKEKCKWERQILIYKITLRWLSIPDEGLKKVSQLGWFGVPTTLSPSLLKELSIL